MRMAQKEVPALIYVQRGMMEYRLLILAIILSTHVWDLVYSVYKKKNPEPLEN